MSDVESVPSVEFARLPRSVGVVDDAFRDFVEEDNRFACAHLVHGGPESRVILCVQHPRIGLLCAPCLIEHLQRHVELAEMACDECGADGCRAQFIFEARPEPFVVRDRSDLVRLVRGCEPCRLAATS